MNKIRILIADDLDNPRKELMDKVSKFNGQYDLEIHSTAYPPEAKELIKRASENNLPYDILFVDINFSSVADKGGRADSGYEIMKYANYHSPVSRIFSYSAHGKDDELAKEYRKLLDKGVFDNAFDKSDYENVKYFNIALENVLVEVKARKFLIDLAANHLQIILEITGHEMPLDSKAEIKSNVESILMLLKNQNLITAKTLLYRLILQLYQRCLELYCEGSKTTEEIYVDSEVNRPDAEKFLIAAGYRKNPLTDKNASPMELGKSKDSALRKIVAYGEFDKFEYGWLLNKYRNDSVHEDFPADISNILFANLTLSLYILKNKGEIKIDRIVTYCQKTKDAGKSDLQKLLAHINRP